MFEKKFILYLFEYKPDVWSVAIFSNIYLLINEEYLDKNQINEKKELNTKPKLFLLIGDKNEIIDENFNESFFELINKYS